MIIKKIRFMPSSLVLAGQGVRSAWDSGRRITVTHESPGSLDGNSHEKLGYAFALVRAPEINP
jgi:hypothetical protein